MCHLQTPLQDHKTLLYIVSGPHGGWMGAAQRWPGVLCGPRRLGAWATITGQCVRGQGPSHTLSLSASRELAAEGTSAGHRG